MLARPRKTAPLNFSVLRRPKKVTLPVCASNLRLRFPALPSACCFAAPLLAQSAPPAALADPAAYAASQFGASFKLDPNIPPMFGDLDGDGKEDLILVGTSSTPLMSKELFNFKVEDPYDSYFGTGDPRITSQFTLHFDGSSRCFLIVFGWRQPPSKSKQCLQVCPHQYAVRIGQHRELAPEEEEYPGH